MRLLSILLIAVALLGGAAPAPVALAPASAQSAAAACWAGPPTRYTPGWKRCWRGVPFVLPAVAP